MNQQGCGELMPNKFYRGKGGKLMRRLITDYKKVRVFNREMTSKQTEERWRDTQKEHKREAYKKQNNKQQDTSSHSSPPRTEAAPPGAGLGIPVLGV